MNNTSLVRSVRYLLPCAVALILSGCATRAGVNDIAVPAAEVVHIKGAARYMIDGVGWQSLKVGDFVKPERIIETGDDSCLDLVLRVPESNAKQQLVRVWENSRVRIDKLVGVGTGAVPDTVMELDLQAGRISGKAGATSTVSRFEVKIPNAVASIRADAYDISAEGKIKARKGSVFLKSPDSNAKGVKEVIVGSHRFAFRPHPS